MAKSKSSAAAAPAADDFRPADGFTAAPGEWGPEVAPDAEVRAPAPPAGVAAAPDLTADERAELARLRAENAALKAAAGPAHAPGKKYVVELKDGPKAVVQCGPTEYPFDAFKRVTGVLGSQHAPVIGEAPADARCGVCDVTGVVPEPRL